MTPDGPPDILGEILASDVDEDVLRALSNRHQRYALYHLLDHESATLDELADVVAGWVATTEAGVTTAADRSSIRVNLYHDHLPKLADADLVEFDQEANVVDRSPLSTTERELIQAACVAEHWTEESTTQ